MQYRTNDNKGQMNSTSLAMGHIILKSLHCNESVNCNGSENAAIELFLWKENIWVCFFFMSLSTFPFYNFFIAKHTLPKPPEDNLDQCEEHLTV